MAKSSPYIFGSFLVNGLEFRCKLLHTYLVITCEAAYLPHSLVSSKDDAFCHWCKV